MKRFCLCLVSCFISLASFNQPETNTPIYQQILDLDYKSSKSDIEKLKDFYRLKKELETTKSAKDSTYILDLLKISKYEFLAQHNFEASIQFAKNALSIAKTFKTPSVKSLIINCYYNLAASYQRLMLFKQALNNYDSVILLCDKNFIDTKNFQLDARLLKADIYFFSGDYQKAIEESIFGIALSLSKKDSSYFAYFLNRKAQSLSYENKLQSAFLDVRSVIPVFNKTNNQYELATAYKILGFVYERKQKVDSAIYFYQKSIKVRLITEDYQQITQDYIALGNFYLNSLNDFKNSEQYYYKSISSANKIAYKIDRSLGLAQANINLGETFTRQQKFEEATEFFLQSFSNLQINLHNSIKENPSSLQLSNISNKDLVIVLMKDKTDLLLQQYKHNHDNTFLAASIQSAIVTDSVITQIRHEQLGEQSKLYWRNKTRDFYTNAIEACYLQNNPTLAFYFMEKSRAVLLNDKLNELGAAAYLPEVENKKQENFQIKIVELEQKLSLIKDTSKEYQHLQIQLLDAKNDFEHYIKSLEQKYPAYYQYKYADEVPSLQSLQKYLAKNNQSFVHYFLGDSSTYILAVTSKSTKFICLSHEEFNKEKLNNFIELCSNKQALNNHYNSFALLSNSIYKKIFQPLQLSSGRIIICSDNAVIPFDALCTDATGKSFLLNNYTFSYVYSARFLLQQFNNATATGNFVGFAPVSFAHYLGVADLTNAADALNTSAAYYTNEKLFTRQNATRNNFFDYASAYSIVSIFSHARADTTDNEPVLFLQDSVIHLSELQLLNNPATKLVLLSACQTNVGKNATGEGIYSLARGFATAGIPSVAATLWKADEQTIYAISEKFNEYLSEGMNKDEALQKAKLFFIQHNSSEKMLPFFWANMILIGNSDAIHLKHQSDYTTLMIVGATLFLIIALAIIYTKRKSSVNKN